MIKMRFYLLTITRCIECPEYAHEGTHYFCRAATKALPGPTEPSSIPAWCPLPSVVSIGAEKANAQT